MTATMGFVEEELAQMWAELLEVTGAPVDLDSEFAGLGGGPEQARLLAARIDEDLGVDVPAAELLGAGTLAEMARLVRAAMGRGAAGPSQGGPGAAGPTGPRPGARQERPQLSFAQQRLWFMQQIDPDTTLYNVPTVLRLRGALDRAALGRALDALVARHEVLRTTYAAPSGLPYQVIADPVPLELPYTDLTGAADPVAEAERVAAEEGAGVFDLAAGPPLRVRLVRVGADEHRLIVTFHHVAVDGWSVEILFRELGQLYGDGEPPAEVPLHYADYASWQRDRLRGETLDALVDHWREALGDDPKALAVPTDKPRGTARSFRGAVTSRELRSELVSAVREFSRGERVTPYMTLLATLHTLLAGWSGAEDITVGTPVAGRDRPELQDLVGCLINMVPVRVRLDGGPGFRELLARVRTAVLDASAHQELPFDKLVEALVSRRSRDFMPVFRVMFSFLKEQPEPVFAGLDGCSLDLTGPQDTAKYDLSLYAQERGDGLALTLEYDTDLFGPDTPAALLAAYERTLAEAISRPGTPVTELAAARFAAGTASGPQSPQPRTESGTERNTHRDR
ncbi:condensation domain-containing protein [Streptomyces sp. C11-1]|uniref:Condensation domain-containing protein n=1 Tax=Streptomyces durocortorensis TaxID=2811104 RepID=A0ABY9W754_9ACTN|nr:condensation domain-containing protein [Streptomyces durocortorensis]WNF29161.1 condensation domain-containing protein [Streptomyces durocortorensis]